MSEQPGGAPPAPAGAGWSSWRVAPSSAFEVQDPHGNVGLVQVDGANFVVTTSFRFADPAVRTMLVAQIVDTGVSEPDAAAKVDDACTYLALQTEDRTDMASIPQFMRWFENTYGRHTLAAIIHDRLITSGKPNGGALGSDTLSDRFFREMMGSAGVPWLKRWIMWAAVAMRSRWAASGVRRLSLVIWITLAFAGIACFVDAIGAGLFGWPRPFDPWLMVAVAVLLPVASGPLWGRQFGASVVAAVAALWILPAAVFASLGYLAYRVLEWGAIRLGRR